MNRRTFFGALGGFLASALLPWRKEEAIGEPRSYVNPRSPRATGYNGTWTLTRETKPAYQVFTTGEMQCTCTWTRARPVDECEIKQGATLKEINKCLRELNEQVKDMLAK